MATGKKTAISKVTKEDPLEDFPQERKTEKRQRKDLFEMDDDNMTKPTGHLLKKKKVDDTGEINTFKSINRYHTGMKKVRSVIEADNDVSEIISQYQASMKKVKLESEDSGTREIHKKVQDLIGEQNKTRKQHCEKFVKNFSEVMSEIEADYDEMKENEQKLEQLTVTFMKCIRQDKIAFKDKAKALNEIISHEKHFDKMESSHMEEREQVLDQHDEDLKKLRDKFNKESKKSAWDLMRRRISQAMQKDD